MTNKRILPRPDQNVNVKGARHLRSSIFPVGKFFLSYQADGIVRWQGRVLAEVTPGRYRVQLYEWLTGSPSDRLVVSARSMHGWAFYDSAEAWHADIERKTGARPLDAEAEAYLFVLSPTKQTPAKTQAASVSPN